jgi:drug/metabolite transporter (DMT)-like permease
VAAAATRFVIGGTDPVTLGAFRFGLGFLFLLPIALARPRRWPRGRDWSAVLALGLLFFAVFFVLFVAALLLGEPIGLNLLVGVAAVFAGIWIASTTRPPAG